VNEGTIDVAGSGEESESTGVKATGVAEGIEGFGLSPEEARVLGCLIEKSMTVPDQYPMSLNGVLVACNQKSNRSPVVTYDEASVELTLRSLTDRGLARMVHKPGDRVVKYKHAADEVLRLSAKEVSLLAVLLLRGPQTPGELRQRTVRYVEFASLPELEATLDDLRHRTPEFVERLEREPGQKENRYRQLLTAESDDIAEARPDLADQPVAPAPPLLAADDLAELRDEVTKLRSRFERLLEILGEDDI
jgi:uncharacterized protein YceH (UPF0502 family)